MRPPESPSGVPLSEPLRNPKKWPWAASLNPAGHVGSQATVRRWWRLAMSTQGTVLCGLVRISFLAWAREAPSLARSRWRAKHDEQAQRHSLFQKVLAQQGGGHCLY